MTACEYASSSAVAGSGSARSASRTSVATLVEGSLRPDVSHLREGFLQLADPRRFVLRDETHAPCEGVRTTPRDTRADECVEELALRQAKPSHHRDSHVREERGLIAHLRAPGEVLSEPLTRFVGDLDALVPRSLTEPLDRAFARGLDGVRATRRLHLGQRSDDPDLVLVHSDLRRSREPFLGKPAGQPALYLFCRCHRLPPAVRDASDVISLTGEVK